MVKLKEDSRYLLRDGTITGPLKLKEDENYCPVYPWYCDDISVEWTETGSSWITNDSSQDIIAEVKGTFISTPWDRYVHQQDLIDIMKEAPEVECRHQWKRHATMDGTYYSCWLCKETKLQLAKEDQDGQDHTL